MTNDVCITGLGIVSAIGIGVEACINNLKEERTGIGPIQHLNTVHKNDFVVGEVNCSNADLLRKLGLSDKDFSDHTRTSLLGIIAAKEAIEQSGLASSDCADIALVSGTTVGGMDKTELFIRSDQSINDFVFTHPCGDSTDKIAAYIKSKAYRTTVSTACSSAANAIMHGAKLIKNGYADRVIAGGVDALSRFTLNGFNSLMILDKEYCKPFDNNRKGLNLGEGAGFLLLESIQSAKARGAKILCMLSGYANSNDAYHQTASSPEGEGAYLAMHKALEVANLSATEIGYINVHGTGTENNDLSEGIAMKRVFGDTLPPFSSTKAFTGHTLGAAAGIEAVLSVLAITKGITYPNLHFSETIEQLEIKPQLQTEEKNLKSVLSNSFGFGGNNSTLIFSKE